jgi:hypothetical protein
MNEKKKIKQVTRFTPGGSNLPISTRLVRIWVCFAIGTLFVLIILFISHITSKDNKSSLNDSPLTPLNDSTFTPVPEIGVSESKIEVRFKDGVPAMIKYKMRYYIKPEDIPRIEEMLGKELLSSGKNYDEKLLYPVLRNVIRSSSYEYFAEDVFSRGTNIILQMDIVEGLQRDLYDHSLATVLSFELKGIRFPNNTYEKLLKKYPNKSSEKNEGNHDEQVPM